MDKRFKWPLHHKSGYSNHPYYHPMRPKKNIGGGDHYYHNQNRGYPRMHYGNARNSGGGHYFYKSPHGRPDHPEPPAPGIPYAPSAGSDVMTLIMENKNMKSMVMLQLNLMQEHTENIAAKEKQIEDQSATINTLSLQNVDLKERNIILEKTVQDLKKQLQRHIKRGSHADYDTDDDDTLPPPRNVSKLCHAETQTSVGTVTIQPTQYKPPYVQQLQLNLHMADKAQPQLIQYEETSQTLGVEEEEHEELEYQLQEQEIHHPELELHQQMMQHHEQELQHDQEDSQMIEQELHEQEMQLHEQELQLHEQELQLHEQELQLPEQEVQQPEQERQRDQENPQLHEQHLQLQKYNQNSQSPHTREKVQVTSVTELPPTTVVKKSCLNLVDSKARGEFNGGKKISTIILHRVHQESNHNIQAELKELEAEEEVAHETSTTEEHDDGGVIAEASDVSKFENDMHMNEEEVEMVEEVVEDVIAEEPDEEKEGTPQFSNVNNGHIDHDSYGESDLFPMTLDCEEHEVQTVGEEVIDEENSGEIILQSEEEPPVMELPMATGQLHQAICLTPDTGTPNQGEQAVPVQMWPESARSEPQVLPIVAASKTTVCELKEIDASQTNHVAPTAHSTPNRQQKYVPDTDTHQIQQTDLADQPDEHCTKQKIRRNSAVDSHVPEVPVEDMAVDEEIEVALPAVKEEEIVTTDTHVIESLAKPVQNESLVTQAVLPKANSTTAAAPTTTAHVSKKFKQSSQKLQHSSIVEAQLTHKTVANHQTSSATTKDQKKKTRLAGVFLPSKPKQQAIVTGTAAKSINTATVSAAAEPSDIKTLKSTAPHPRQVQLLNHEEQIIKKLQKHIHKQFEQLPQVQLKRTSLSNKQTVSLIYPPEPTTKADPITPAPTPASTPTPTSGSSSPQTAATATTKSISEINSTPIQAPLTPISNVSNSNSSSSSSSSTTVSTARSNSTSSASTAAPVGKSRTVKDIKPLARYAKSKSTSRFLSTSTLYTTRAWEDEEFHCDYEFFLEEADELLSENPQLEIPKWEIVHIQPAVEETDIESITDQDFEQRHEKCVRDEIDRKKRDARYYREQVRSEDLRKRHNQDEILIPLDPLPKSTFYPLPEDIESIEYVTEVPVQAFGSDIVNLEARGEFMLPWLEMNNADSDIHAAKARAAPVATLASKKLHTTDAEARYQEMNSSFVYLKKRKRQRR